MIEIAIALFFITFTLELFGRRVLSLALLVVGLLILFGMLAYYYFSNIRLSSQPMLLLSIYSCGIAWTWGVIIGSLIRVVRSGQTQIAFGRPNDNWLGFVAVMASGLLGAYQLGFALATNSDMIYAGSTEEMWSMYNKSIEAAYAGIFWLSLAGHSLMIATVKPAIRSRGILFPSALFVEWKHIGSYEWKSNALIVQIKSKFLLIWPRKLSLVAPSAEQEAVNHILTQHLPDKQVQPPISVQVTT
jgi:hypothetical protein